MSTGLVSGVTSGIVEAIRKAAETTGSGFSYLLNTGIRESRLNPTAKASSSSASGLYQFTSQTWLQTVKQAGPSLGLGTVAAKISRTSGGRYTVDNAADRKQILALRQDPSASALMAGALANRNAAALTSALGRQPTDGELYIAHFLGAKGATSLLSLAASAPTTSAATAFPAAAAANPSIFYASGKALGAAAVTAKLTAMETSPGGTSAASLPLAFADSAPSAQSPADVVVDEHGPVFNSIFRTGRRTPVASYVDAVWSGVASANAFPTAGQANPLFAAASADTSASGSGGRRRPLDLLGFLRPAVEDA